MLTIASSGSSNLCNFAWECIFIFDNIIKKFENIEICVFGTGIHDPKSEKYFNLVKIRKIMEVNYFGTMNSINSIYDYFNTKKNKNDNIH